MGIAWSVQVSGMTVTEKAGTCCNLKYREKKPHMKRVVPNALSHHRVLNRVKSVLTVLCEGLERVA